jgi:hypothetical protein
VTGCGQLEDQVARLLVSVEEQHADYEQRLREQQAEIAALRAEAQGARETRMAGIVECETPEPPATVSEPPERASDGKRALATSRRRLLTGAGTAAAAATVAAVALTHPQSAEAASAAPAARAADGGNLIIGESNNGTKQTQLIVSGSDPMFAFFKVGGAGNPNPNGCAIAAINSSLSGGTGVFGQGKDFGVSGWGKVDLYASHSGRIQQQLQLSAGPPRNGSYFAGEQISDSNGELWLCIAGAGENVGTWVKVAHTFAGYTGGATTYLSK